MKTTSDLFLPVSGKVIEVNSALTKEPELGNSDPFIRGWMIKIEINSPAEANQLLNAEAYQDIQLSGIDLIFNVLFVCKNTTPELLNYFFCNSLISNDLYKYKYKFYLHGISPKPVLRVRFLII